MPKDKQTKKLHGRISTRKDNNMGVFLRGKTYWYEFKLNNIRVRESAKTNNKVLAEKIETKRRNDLLSGMNGIEPKPTFKLFSVAVQEFIEDKKMDWSPSTLRMHLTSLPKVLAYFGKMVLHEITSDDIRAYQKYRKGQVSKAIGKPVSNRTINTEIVLIRQLLMKHKLWLKLTEGSDVGMLRENKHVGRKMRQEELIKLLEACRNSPSRAIFPAVLLSIYTGLRSKELRTLKWEQINFESWTIQVGKSKTDAGSGRMIQFNQDGFNVLHNWKMNFPGVKPKHYVFPSQRYGLIGAPEIRGGVVAPYKTYPDRPTASLNTSWRSCKAAAGVECRWHDLRHTCTSLLADGGAMSHTLQAMLGWDSNMAERYSHSTIEAQKTAQKYLEGRVREMLNKVDELQSKVVQ
jgi:integrase